MKFTKQQQKEVNQEVNKQLKLRQNLLSKSKQTAVYISSEFKQHTSTALIAAFGFLIALVWRDLIIKLIQENITLSTKYPYLAELYTAIIITIIAVIGIALISKWAKQPTA